MKYIELEKDFKYYIDHQDELVERYRDRFVVVKNQTVIAAYDDELEAIEETQKEHELGTFLVQLCAPGVENYTQTYHSGVSF